WASCARSATPTPSTSRRPTRTRPRCWPRSRCPGPRSGPTTSTCSAGTCPRRSTRRAAAGSAPAARAPGRGAPRRSPRCGRSDPTSSSPATSRWWGRVGTAPGRRRPRTATGTPISRRAPRGPSEPTATAPTATARTPEGRPGPGSDPEPAPLERLDRLRRAVDLDAGRAPPAVEHEHELLRVAGHPPGGPTAPGGDVAAAGGDERRPHPGPPQHERAEPAHRRPREVVELGVGAGTPADGPAHVLVVHEPLVGVEQRAQARHPPRHERRARPQPFDQGLVAPGPGPVPQAAPEAREPLAAQDDERGPRVALAQHQVGGEVQRRPALAQRRRPGPDLEEEVAERRPLTGVERLPHRH